MSLKPFQRATVRRVLEAFQVPKGSRRFLVADEVGLGKTRVAQGVIQGLCRQDKHFEVFYVCSSLSIIHQNREALLDFLPPTLRKDARVEVDRLTLLPTVRPTQAAPFTLYTLTPGTLPAGRRTGRADERAVIWQLLCTTIPGLARFERIEGAFRRGVQYWEYHLAKAEPNFNWDLSRRFRRELAHELELAEAPWSSTFIQRMRREVDAGRDRELVGKSRLALARAALDKLSPDLIIFDEFQRFFEVLVPGDDDDPVARQIIKRLLRVDKEETPAILLLSATPYRPFSAWADGATDHYDQFFKLLGFLHGARARSEVPALQADLKEYRDRLKGDHVGSPEVLAVRDRIATRLAQVMSRTERPRTVNGTRELEFVQVAAPLEPADIRLFRHLRDSARKEDRASAPAYWSSIPYPLQMMDSTYLFAARADLLSLDGEARDACMAWRKLRRFASVGHPHPRLRALLTEVPRALLAAPWMSPTRPWWPLGGVFTEVPANASKALVFSRFRAVPRSLAAALSYEAERWCFAPDRQRARGLRPIGYEYRTDRGERPAAGLRKRPSPTFTFPLTSKHETSMRAFLMFVPMPALAHLGDPLPFAVSRSRLGRNEMLAEVERRLAEKLGVASGRRRPSTILPWVVQLEHAADTWPALESGLTEWQDKGLAGLEDDDEGQSRGVQHAVEVFLTDRGRSDAPTRQELRELAEIALLAPGNVLFRATERVFGGETNRTRIIAVTGTSVGALRAYLDLPDFHLLLRTPRHRQHPAAVRQAVWDGNLESVLDEHLATVRGLGEERSKAGVEQKSLSALGQALGLGAGNVLVREVGTSSAREPFRVRCHAAMAFGLGRQEKESGSGELHSDALRVAFNSPFRPHVLITTSIGQEGLDFHVWCHHVVHWDLPSSPVDLEQRDGRVDRYGGLAVRRALASSLSPLPRDASPWRQLAELQTERAQGLSPWWICPGAQVRRTVFVPPFSRLSEDLESLREQLSLYRLALGQADQEALMHALQRRVAETSEEEGTALKWLEEARIDLCPSPLALTQDGAWPG